VLVEVRPLLLHAARQGALARLGDGRRVPGARRRRRRRARRLAL